MLAATDRTHDYLSEACQLAQDNLATLRRLKGAVDPGTIEAMMSLAKVLKLQRKWDETEKVLDAVLAAMTKGPGENSQQALETMHVLAGILANQNRFKESRQLFEKEYDIRRRIYGEKDIGVRFGAKLLGCGQAASWSPDGKQIIFGHGFSESGILIYDVATGKTSDFRPNGKDPAWVGKDGHWIAYLVESEFDEAVWVDRFPAVKGFRSFRVATGSMPSWSDDGKTLFFQVYDKDQLVSTEITETGQFSPPRDRTMLPYRFPSVSPDGKRVAFANDGNLVIREISSGKVLKRYILPNGYGILGRWSPDGQEFGFGGFGPADPMPCIILNVESGLARQVATRLLTLPSWSPDGTKIAFDLRRDGGTEVWMVDAAVIKELPAFKMKSPDEEGQRASRNDPSSKQSDSRSGTVPKLQINKTGR